MEQKPWWERLLIFALTMAVIVPFHIFVARPMAHWVMTPVRDLLEHRQSGSTTP
jgi:hypothetical protein